MIRDDTIERTSVIAYGVLQELHNLLAKSGRSDDVSLGLVMGLAMFMDEKIGPFRSQKLFQQAPNIVLKADAYVSPDQIARFSDLLHAFGEHLARTPAPCEKA